MKRSVILVVILALVAAAGCSSDDGPSTTVADTGPRFPDVTAAVASRDREGTWSFTVTVSSPYDSPERYADAWRVRGAGGRIFGVRNLGHDHANEQPFTRSLGGVQIPAGVRRVVIEARDSDNGYGGSRVTLTLPDAP